jgi:hypothetical protein
VWARTLAAALGVTLSMMAEANAGVGMTETANSRERIRTTRSCSQGSRLGPLRRRVTSRKRPFDPDRRDLLGPQLGPRWKEVTVEVDANGRPMIQMIHTDLSESGHSHLAADVVLGKNGRPLWKWRKLGRRGPTKEEVHLVHAVMLRAYEACAPHEVGEEPGKFTRSPDAWLDAIVRARRNGRSSGRSLDCDGRAQRSFQRRVRALARGLSRR